MIESLKTDKAPAAIGPYSQAVKIENLVFISGQLPINPETKEIKANIKEQTIQVLENIKAILDAVNLNLNNIVKTTVFLKDFNDFNIVNEVYGNYFKEKHPARSTIEVSRLPKDALIEIEAIASF